MQRFLLFLMVGCALGALTGRPLLANPRPNVIIVLTDDQGLGDFSCYGNPVLRTPNLDRLHRQSIRLADFHVAPMCTPTRGQLLTGLDAVRNGATSVTGGRSFIRPSIATMPQMLAAAGYRTGLFGKWHLGDNYPHRPMDRGFQEAVYHLGWGFTSAPEFANTLFDGRYFHNGLEKKFPGHCTDFWFDQAMQWMRRRHEAREPFFCYLPTNAPHAPHDVAGKYSQPYEGKGPAAFFGMIAQIDENMGRLESFLDETGLRDNTILIFMTDNGGTAGVDLWNAGLRGRKATYYEGGHRAAGWIRWPAGNLGPPRDIATPTHVQDILPTLLALTSTIPPPNASFDGRSLAKLLREDDADGLADRMFVVQYSRATLEKWECAVVSDRWRLVHGKELYDIHADLAQERDLAAEHPQIVAKLRDHYEDWWAGLEPLSRQFVPTHIGSEHQTLVLLTSSDWQDVYADNAGHVRNAAGGPRGGHWNIHVERPGRYEVTLRRWPREIDAALGDPVGPAPSKALPVAAARITAAGRDYVASADPRSKEVLTRIDLPAGPAQLQAWFQDSAGQDLCGAFYVYIHRAD
jgi:arylsulfatase A-like enzyme